MLCIYFWVDKKSIYKTHPEEYKKYKQYIFTASLKNNPYDLTKTQDAADFQSEYNSIKAIIDSEPEFNIGMYNTYQNKRYPYIDYAAAKENFKYSIDINKYISKNDGAWKWIKDITELKDLSTENIHMPKSPKIGELALLISSGLYQWQRRIR